MRGRYFDRNVSLELQCIIGHDQAWTSDLSIPLVREMEGVMFRIMREAQLSESQKSRKEILKNLRATTRLWLSKRTKVRRLGRLVDDVEGQGWVLPPWLASVLGVDVLRWKTNDLQSRQAAIHEIMNMVNSGWTERKKKKLRDLIKGFFDFRCPKFARGKQLARI